MATLLKTMIPRIDGIDTTPMNILDGCRVLPRPNLDAPLGFLLWNAPPSTNCNFIATAEEQDFFAFASDSMVNTTLSQDASELIDTISKAAFNVRKLAFADLGDILARPQSPTSPSSAFVDRDMWMLKFWGYLIPKMRTLYDVRGTRTSSFGVSFDTLLAKGSLQDRKIYRFSSNNQWRYLTPRGFEAQPCVIQPLDDQQRKFCKEIPGLQIIDRNCVPSLLLETEGDLKYNASFGRLLQAFENLERTTRKSTKVFLSNSLNDDSKEILQGLLLNHLNTGNLSNVKLLRGLPVWRRLSNFDPGPQLSISLLKTPNSVAIQNCYCHG